MSKQRVGVAVAQALHVVAHHAGTLQRTAGHAGRGRLSKLSDIGCRVLASTSQPTEVGVLLLDELIKHRRAQLRECTLRVTTTQATSGRCVLQQRGLRLVHHLRVAGRGFQRLDRCLLRLWPVKPRKRPLLRESVGTRLLVLVQPTKATHARFSVRLLRLLRLLCGRLQLLAIELALLLVRLLRFGSAVGRDCRPANTSDDTSGPDTDCDCDCTHWLPR